MRTLTFRLEGGDVGIDTSMIFLEELGLEVASAGARVDSLALRPRVVGPFSASLRGLEGDDPLTVFAFFGVAGA